MNLNVYGAIVPNAYKWYYDYFGEDCTCPRDVAMAIEAAAGECLDVYINSPGGEIASGSEIYTMLRAYGNLKEHIVGQACSAASIIAMAGYCDMSPTALMMVHCVSTNPGRGNHTHMEHTAEVLRTADEALCNAYLAKTGASREEILSMMEHETWLTAAQAKERGLIDGIMFETSEEPQMMNSGFSLPDKEKMNHIKKIMEARTGADHRSRFLQQQLNYLKLRR